jgi:hypothetical protein
MPQRRTAIGVPLLAIALVATMAPATNARADPQPPDPAAVEEAERDLTLRTVPGSATATYAFYRDEETGALVVETASTTGDFADALRQTYRSAVEVRELAISRAGRNDDANPHFGGARLHLQNYTQGCSSGVVLVRAGVRHMVTTGHCYLVNANVYSGPHYYGLVNIRRFPDPDLELINGNAGSSGQGTQTYLNSAYTNPGTPGLRTVSTRWTTVVGHYICTGGSYSLERCGARVNTTSASFCDTDGCTHNLARAQNPGKLTSQLGDSGGPVYQKPTANGLAFQGIIVATSLNLSNTSGDTVWFHTLSTIESSLGGTVLTSPASQSVPDKGPP